MINIKHLNSTSSTLPKSLDYNTDQRTDEEKHQGQETVLSGRKVRLVNQQENKLEPRIDLVSPKQMKGIACSAHIKKLLWFSASLMIPMRTVHNVFLTGSKSIEESLDITKLIQNEANLLIDSNQIMNNLIINDSELSNTGNRYSIADELFQRLSESIEGLKLSDNKNNSFNNDMKYFIKHNTFEHLMLKDYQKSVIYEAHIANHMAVQEIERYTNQIDNLKETITELRIEVARAEAWIDELESNVATLTETLTEILETSKNLVSTSQRICDVLKSIPGIKSIKMIKNICASIVKLNEGIHKADNTLAGANRRSLLENNCETKKTDWQDKWPRLQHWVDVLTDISNSLNDHPDFITPSLPTEEGQHYLEAINDFYFLKNVSNVIDSNERKSEQLANEYVTGLDELINELNNRLFNNLTDALNNSERDDNNIDDFKSQLSDLPEQVKAAVTEVIDDIMLTLEDNNWTINEKLYFYSALGAIFSMALRKNWHFDVK